jgi:hypothetical protein
MAGMATPELKAPEAGEEITLAAPLAVAAVVDTTAAAGAVLQTRKAIQEPGGLHLFLSGGPVLTAAGPQ